MRRPASMLSLALITGVLPPQLAAGPSAAVSASASAHHTLAEAEAALIGSDWYAAPANEQPDEAAPWRTGSSLFLSSTLSSNDEIIDVGRRRTFQAAGMNAGVRIPLLGSRQRQQADRQQRGVQSFGANTSLELQRRALLAQTRLAYVQLWSAATRSELAERYLATRTLFEPILQRRQEAGLLLGSDRQEFLAGFAAVTADQTRSTADLRAASALLLKLSGLTFADVRRPALASPCVALAATDADLDDLLRAQPQLQWLQMRLEQSANSADALRHERLQADLRVGLASSWETSGGAPGHSAYAAVNFDYALDRQAALLGSQQIERRTSLAALRQEQARVFAELTRLAASAQPLADNLTLARQARQAAELRVHERAQRAARLAGDVIEQLQQARLQWYRAQLAEHVAERDLLEWQIEATRYDTPGCVGARAPTPRASPAPDRALYVWASEPLLAALRARQSSALLTHAGALGVTRLRVSLNADQLARYRQDPQALASALTEAHQRNYRIELLLGDPHWLLPANRASLLAIVADLNTLPFDGLHLDLEPSQLAAPGGDGLEFLPQLLATLREVGAISPWPMGLSVHPRELAAPVDGRRFGSALAQLGIEVSVMIYVADPSRVASLAAASLHGFPQLRARIAVSLEPELDGGHGLARLGEPALTEQLQSLQVRLGTTASAGLALQVAPGWPASITGTRDAP